MPKGRNSRGRQIKPAPLQAEKHKIVTTDADRLSGDFRFSLKYLQQNHSKFKYDNRDANYFCQLLYILSTLSSKKVNDILKDPTFRKAMRIHKIDWADSRVTETCFDCLDEQLQLLEAWQFQLSSNEHGRVHGFFIDTTFYVVWLDPDHALYK